MVNRTKLICFPLVYFRMLYAGVFAMQLIGEWLNTTLYLFIEMCMRKVWCKRIRVYVSIFFTE